MAKGAVSKEIVTNKLLEVFEGAFIASDGKTIRIPLIEDGTAIEIKCALTAAKDLEGAGAGSTNSVTGEKSTWTGAPATAISEPTQQELDNVNRLAELLGF